MRIPDTGKLGWSVQSYLSKQIVINYFPGLDSEMEKEIEDLRRRYNAKRQPILDAMDQKRKRQQNF